MLWRRGLDSAGSWCVLVALSYQHGDESSGYIMGGNVIVRLSDYQLLKKGPASSFCVNEFYVHSVQ
jgi:hypothetical protein